ncbi:MAG: endonuclease/exonuclease/phosphatase family protein [Cyclobacteriaceae bacterium]
MIKRLYLAAILPILLLSACSDDTTNTIVIDRTDKSPIKVEFDVSDASVEEEDPAITVNITFSRKLENATDVIVDFTASNGLLNENFKITPDPTDGEFKLSAAEGEQRVAFQVQPLADDNDNEELLVFQLKSIGDEALEKGDLNSFRLRILDEDPIDPAFRNCLSAQSSETLEVVTWNIENFPMTSNSVSTVVDIIRNMDVDIIAVQEINDPAAFTTVVNSLEGWGGKFYDVRGGIELGYFYKTTEITAFSDLEIIFPDQNSPFPRQAVVATATHVNGLEVKLVNLHLKCCDDGSARRANASNLMKTFFDENEKDSNLIVLGDYNDEIDVGSPFQNFMLDTDNYVFADQEIADGTSQNWSYPSFPSHIDHILISDELFDNHISSKTIKLSPCVNYSRDVSDHRPVMAVFKAD